MSVAESLPSGYVYDTARLLVQAKPLLQLDWLIHGSTTRAFSLPDAPRIAELHHLKRHLGLPEVPLVHAEQKHTNHVALVTPDDLKSLTPDGRFVHRNTDALVCPLRGIMIAVLTADCAPVFIADTKTRAIALAHAGWKGTLDRIVERTVETLAANGSDPADLVAWVGPMIAGCCYEVSPELVVRFREGFPDAAAQGVRFHQGRLLDLVALNCFQLQKQGVRTEAIHRSGICTLHHRDEFYTYRGDNGTHGRIISCMYVKP